MEQFSQYNWRGPRITDVAELKNAGIERSISLETSLDYRFYKTNELTPQDGIELIRIACSDITPPSEAQVYRCLSLLVEPKKTYLHCYSGVDRTGFMVAVYRMQVEGVPFDVASKEWVDKGRHWWYSWWAKELKRYERNR